MNEAELKAEFKRLMPDEIQGNKRPDEPIASDNDFFLDVPQLIAKDPVINDSMNLILSVGLSNDNYLKNAIDGILNDLNLFDYRTATQTLKGLMSAADKTKLDGIEVGANNYTHPTSGVKAGTYKSVTVNAQGHVTAGSNPTTLAGYGITDAPTKTGSGATGTWNISINGTANKANSATTATTATSATNAAYATSAGSATQATKLTTARTFSIADKTTPTSVSFNGTGDVSLGIPSTIARVSDVTALKTALKGQSAPTMTALVDWSAMNIALYGTDSNVDFTTYVDGVQKTVSIPRCKNLRNTTRNIFAYGGDESNTSSGTNRPFYNGDIILKADYTQYDKILIVGTDDDCNLIWNRIWDTWELQYFLEHAYAIALFNNQVSYWEVYGCKRQGTNSRQISTNTRWYRYNQNCGIVEIYGLKY